MRPEEISRFLNVKSALTEFVTVVGTQAQEHIKPFHKYVALRLVFEGGFAPDEVSPRPPLTVDNRGKRRRIRFDESVEGNGEQTVLGGLKSKRVDVVVAKRGVGPVVAVSIKGTGNAFRNLTNRMEEAIGDSTNIHIMYPGLVYGFLHLLKANREGKFRKNDVSVDMQGRVVPAIARYHDVLRGLTGRRFVRNDFTRYEAVTLVMVDSSGKRRGEIFGKYPSLDSPLHLSRFFASLYNVYDLRFPYVSASVPSLERIEWDSGSPAFVQFGSLGQFTRIAGYTPRVSHG
ncbi:MAG: hypothetical protein HYT87_08850 [Nitrospirae bacterium]|nr:hypothetical protein [Nitrospirota bacterium]